MGFLNPLLLAAAAAIGVPLLLHLFRRRESRRVPFPALRYLLRTERDHARRIRLRQLLLLLLRVSAVLLLALAASQPFLRSGAGAHPSTALAIVLDNSMSSGRVFDGESALDRLKRAALATVDLANDDDRVWVLRAGDPWDVATPESAADARDRIWETEVSAAASDLADAAGRAAGLVLQAGLAAAEVHVLSDLQATALGEPLDSPPDVPVLVFAGARGGTAGNRYLGELLIGGGLPPLAHRPTELSVQLGGDTVEAPLRLVVEDQIRAASIVPPGATATLPFGPFAEGWVSGYVETDPDDLVGDNRRWFVLAVELPPEVNVRGASEDAYFLLEAIEVLEEAGRLSPGDADPDVVIAGEGAGASEVRAGRTVVVVPPADAALLPAVNRRLAEAGIPWRYEVNEARGDARIGESRLRFPLEDVSVAGGYRLVSAAGAGHEVVVRLTDGSPWLVAGGTEGGPYRLVGSPLKPDATNLPVTAFMIPLLEWLVAPPGREGGLHRAAAGTPLALPQPATAVVTPDGVRHPVDGAQDFRVTRTSGIYRVLAGDSVLSLIAVNPPVQESLLEAADRERVASVLGTEARVIADLGAWTDAVFTERHGRELGHELLLAALLVLVVESWAAATGAATAQRRPRVSPNRTGDARASAPAPSG